MKLYIAVSAAFLATLALGQAQTTATLNLSGTVAKTASIVVNPLAAATALSVDVGQTDIQVANVVETSNDASGYTVNVASLNAAGAGNTFLLKSGSTTVNYSIKYGGSAVVVASGASQVTDATAATPQAGKTKAVSVTIPASFVPAGTYTDTLTFTIATK